MSSNQNPLELADLLKRSKELDAQQEYIDTQRKLLEDAPISLSVYTAQVEAKTEQLGYLKKDIEIASTELKDIKHDIIVQRDKSKADMEYQATEFAEATSKNDQIKNSIYTKAKELKLIEDDIKTQTTYFKTQDQQISILIAEGNEKLLELNSQVRGLEQDILTLTAQRTTLKAKIDELILKIQDLEDSFGTLDQEYTKEKEDLEAELEIISKDIVAEQQKYKNISLEANQKLKFLNEKEESIIAKRDAMVLERQELEQDQRRWNSKKALYPQDMA
jgi:chromosome segregation ATPase